MHDVAASLSLRPAQLPPHAMPCHAVDIARSVLGQHSCDKGVICVRRHAGAHSGRDGNPAGEQLAQELLHAGPGRQACPSSTLSCAWHCALLHQLVGDAIDACVTWRHTHAHTYKESRGAAASAAVLLSGRVQAVHKLLTAATSRPWRECNSLAGAQVGGCLSEVAGHAGRRWSPHQAALSAAPTGGQAGGVPESLRAAHQALPLLQRGERLGALILSMCKLVLATHVPRIMEQAFTFCLCAAHWCFCVIGLWWHRCSLNGWA